MVEENGQQEFNAIDITSPYRLERGATVCFRHSHSRPTHFYFDVNSNEKVILNSIEETYCTRTVDVFITADTANGQAGPNNHQWKSEYGPNTVEIDPNTDIFRQGRF